jgi:two-component sensor histidine kinase
MSTLGEGPPDGSLNRGGQGGFNWKVLARIIDDSSAFIQAADLQYRWLLINKASASEFERIYGLQPRPGLSMLDVLADKPEHQAAVKAVWSRALAGEEFTEVAEFGEPGRDRRIYEMTFNSLRGSGGELIGAYQIVYDVTDPFAAMQAVMEESAEFERQIGELSGHLTRTEKRQDVLLAELQHRVRNMLARMTMLVSQTGKNGEALDVYRQHLSGRVAAMARVQSRLTRDPDALVELNALVQEELMALSPKPSRISVAGPSVQVGPKVAEALTLALHELTANAAKFGGLRDEVGRVDVSWTTEIQDNELWLCLVWLESEISIEAGKPSYEGFGTKLLTRQISYELGGEVTLKYNPSGLRCTLNLPLRDGASILQTDASRIPGLE